MDVVVYVVVLRQWWCCDSGGVSVVAARGVVEKRRVRESGVEDRIDRGLWIVFRVCHSVASSRRKSFPAVVAGGEWWPAGWAAAGGEGVERVKKNLLSFRKRCLGALITLFVPVSLAMVKDDIFERIRMFSHYGRTTTAHLETFKATINSKETMITPIESKHIRPYEAR
nr:hypothetical protein [Tanacetum cinerariifolium]